MTQMVMASSIKDACPNEPEDIDLYQDHDGCAEPTELTIRFIDQFGVPVHGKKWDGDKYNGFSGVPIQAEAGALEVFAELDGYRPIAESIEVHEGDPMVVDIPVEMLLGEILYALLPVWKNHGGCAWSIDGGPKRYDSMPHS